MSGSELFFSPSLSPFGAHSLPSLRASPRLKDAQIPQEDVRRLYIEILVLLRVIFARCKLVHADFSEYNILCVFCFPSFLPSTATTLLSLPPRHIASLTHPPVPSPSLDPQSVRDETPTS